MSTKRKTSQPSLEKSIQENVKKILLSVAVAAALNKPTSTKNK